MKKLIILAILTNLSFGDEDISQMDRDGLYGVVPNKTNKYEITIRENHYIKIKAYAIFCKTVLYNEKWQEISSAGVITNSIEENLPNGTYYLTVTPTSTACKNFTVTTNEEKTITNKSNFIDSEQIHNGLIEGMTMPFKKAGEILISPIKKEVKNQEMEEKYQREKSEKEKAKKDLLKQMQS